MTKNALVTGITGQDGSYLGEALLAAGWDVAGVVRDQAAAGEHPVPVAVEAHAVDLTDTMALRGLVREVRPDVIFNLAGISSVAASWERPVETAQVNGVAVLALLDAASDLARDGSAVRLVQASSAEIFGDAEVSPQNESTPLAPLNPYGAAKAFAHTSVRLFRDRGLWASSAILFNHESPRRPESFVTRKITAAAARVALGLDADLVLGNLDARRDWGWAPDYIDALLRIAGAEEADDYVVATGETHSVREFAAAAFAAAGVEDWQRHVRTDPAFVRPADVRLMCGDASRLRERLGWSPSMAFEQLVSAMVASDVGLLRSAT